MKEQNTVDHGDLISISASYNAGWQQRTVGMSYQSLSAHGLLISGETGKIVGYVLLAKTALNVKQNERKKEKH